MGATETVAQWIVNTTREDMPPDALRAAKESCFDCIGVSLAGSVQPVEGIIRRYVEEQGGAPEATILRSGLRTSVSNAALVNGTLAHALDYDDWGGFGHPTTCILPAILALGQKIGATGRDLLEAYVVGCEVGVALQRAVKVDLIDRGFHRTVIFGRLASAAACAKLLGLDEHQTTMALGIAGSSAGGLVSNHGTMTKPLHAGQTARDGTMAAQLAQKGFGSGKSTLEHPGGFVVAFFGEFTGGLQEMADNLGKPFLTPKVLAIKKYPCCGGNHGPLDSLLGLMREHKFDYRDVESVEVDAAAGVMMYSEPEDGIQGKFSIRYNLAAALVEGKVDNDTFTDKKVKDPLIRETMKKVRPNVLPSGVRESEMRGEVPLPAHTRVRLKDGREFAHAAPAHQLLGLTQNRWGFEDIKGKFRANALMALPEHQVEEAIRVWGDMEQIEDLDRAVETLVAAKG